MHTPPTTTIKGHEKEQGGCMGGAGARQGRGKLCNYNFKNKKYTHKKEADNWDLDVLHK